MEVTFSADTKDSLIRYTEIPEGRMAEGVEPHASYDKILRVNRNFLIGFYKDNSMSVFLRPEVCYSNPYYRLLPVGTKITFTT